MIFSILSLLHVLIVLGAPPALGAVLVRQIERSLAGGHASPVAELNSNVLYVVGLGYYLLSSFLLKCTGVPWAIAIYVPLLLIALDREGTRAIPRFFRVDPSLNFVLWFFTVFAIGLSVLFTGDGLQTAWVNNYGDATYHIGMITSFVFGDNIPPEYHIFTGLRLSYPFFINFWSALCWWPSSDWHFLGLIFTAQWSILWVLIYRLLSGNKYVLIPWAVLLGGGSYALLGSLSTDFIREGYPWAVFISTIWVPQRTFALGLVCVLAALRLVYCGVGVVADTPISRTNRDEKRLRLLLLSILLPISLLCHGHSTLVAGLFLVLVFVSKQTTIQFGHGRDAAEANPLFTRKTVLLCAAVLVTLTAVVSPWLIGKSGILHFSAGWSGVKTADTVLAQIEASSRMWGQNAWHVLVLLLPLFFTKRYGVEIAICCLLFVVFNIVQLSVWQWDQIKIFITVYCMLLALWSFSRERVLYYAHFILIMLCVPGLVETVILFNRGAVYTMYTPDKINQAEVVRKSVAPDTVLAAAPYHNSVVTLTGRSMFLGYAGTLWSHKIDSTKRTELQKSLPDLANCREKAPPDIIEYCPQYLVWDSEAEKYWKQSAPDIPGIRPVGKGGLYKLY